MRFRNAAVVSLAMVALAPPVSAATLPRPAHVVVVIEENHTFAQIVGNPHAPFLTALAARGAAFTNAHGVTHPSLPNYFALFAGIQNTNGDGCPARAIPANAPNLGSELDAAHLSFVGYAESMPEEDWHGCWAGSYARKHVPWAQFANLPRTASEPFSAFPSDFDRLPTVAFVVPNVDDDMHDGTVAQADAWARTHLGPLVRWAQTHDTLVILTMDEGYDSTNSIPIIFAGPMVQPGRYAQRIDHYNVLRTLADMYGLVPPGHAARVAPITDCWRAR
ncbi:MAG: alkaline phosphatase family protein [Vulcanimicrobiaceae bacterium]|jgi:acid phosphatase